MESRHTAFPVRIESNFVLTIDHSRIQLQGYAHYQALYYYYREAQGRIQLEVNLEHTRRQ